MNISKLNSGIESIKDFLNENNFNLDSENIINFRTGVNKFIDHVEEKYEEKYKDNRKIITNRSLE